ncbi:MAG: aspartate/glutamate racemase family protein [Bacteroidota bacterium]
MNRIGIIDWGIGGLGLCRYLTEKGAPPLIYFSDSGFTPYGKVEKTELKKRVEKVIGWMLAQGCTHVAVACNAASTVTYRDNPKIIDIITHGLALLNKMKDKKVALLGGRRTVLSRCYALGAPEINIRQRIAQPLSALVEAGELNSKKLHDTIEKIVKPVRNCDVIFLACTHYPAVVAQIREHLPEQIMISDPAESMGKWILEHWKPFDKKCITQFYTSGNAETMRVSGRKAFGVEMRDVSRIKV